MTIGKFAISKPQPIQEPEFLPQVMVDTYYSSAMPAYADKTLDEQYYDTPRHQPVPQRSYDQPDAMSVYSISNQQSVPPLQPRARGTVPPAISVPPQKSQDNAESLYELYTSPIFDEIDINDPPPLPNSQRLTVNLAPEPAGTPRSALLTAIGYFRK